MSGSLLDPGFHPIVVHRLLLAVLATLVALTPLVAEAQDPPIRWGRLSDTEKTIDSWPDDPDASAIILGDVGFSEVRIDGGRGVTFRLRHHKRVKVLDADGYGLGEFSLRFRGDRDTDVRRIRAQTFVPDGQGDFRRVELSGRDIFDDEVEDGIREVRFSMPALAPGAIFEYEYTYETESITVLPTWTFQSEEPTLVSELRFETPQFFDYVSILQGDHIETMPQEQVNGIDFNAVKSRWVARDVPALRDEPYTTTEADYVERIGFQLSRVNRLDGFVDQVLTTWETVAQELRDNASFGRRMERNPRVREIAESVEGTPAEKARALYDIVRRDYVWTGRGGIFAERDLDDVVQTKSGSEAELTFLLLEMFEEAGIPAQPVILSGRSNGRAIRQYPIVSQFDTILALVQIPGEAPELLSPLNRHRPYGQIPEDALNENAWIADADGPAWIAFDAPGGTATTTFISGTLTEDGALTGDLQLRLTGYDAFDARVRLSEAESGSPSDAAEAVEETADAEEDVEIDVVEVIGVDTPEDPLSVKATFVAPSAEVVGDEMYVSPFVAMQLDENPFERETRTFPVDFAYPFTRTYVADISVPEGWQPIDLPDPVQMTIPSRAVTYTRTMAPRPGGLQVRAVLTVAASKVQPVEYPALRDLYDEIVAAETEAVVIARMAEAPAEAPTDEAMDELVDGAPEAMEDGQ